MNRIAAANYLIYGLTSQVDFGGGELTGNATNRALGTYRELASVVPPLLLEDRSKRIFSATTAFPKTRGTSTHNVGKAIATISTV